MVFHGVMSFFFLVFFQGSRLVFHGSIWVLRVIDGSRSVFIVPGRFFMVPGGFFMVLGRFGFSRFQVGFSCFFIVPGMVFMIH